MALRQKQILPSTTPGDDDVPAVQMMMLQRLQMRCLGGLKQLCCSDPRNDVSAASNDGDIAVNPGTIFQQSQTTMIRQFQKPLYPGNPKILYCCSIPKDTSPTTPCLCCGVSSSGSPNRTALQQGFRKVSFRQSKASCLFAAISGKKMLATPR